MSIRPPRKSHPAPIPLPTPTPPPNPPKEEEPKPDDESIEPSVDDSLINDKEGDEND